MTQRFAASDAAEPGVSPNADAGSAFTLRAGSYHRDELRVAAFRCTERMSQPFSLDVTVGMHGLDPAEVEVALPGQPATLSIPLPHGAVRSIHGVVAWVQIEGTLLHGHHLARFRIVPRIWMLKRRINSRIFQDKSVVDVLRTVLDEARVPHRIDLAARYPKRGYCVQHQETDFDFISRLCAEEGIFYWFDHSSGAAQSDSGVPRADLVVFADDAGAVPAIAGEPVLLYRASEGSTGLSPKENHVQHLTVRRTVRPTGVLLRDYDFKRPLLRIEAMAHVSQSAGVGSATTTALAGLGGVSPEAQVNDAAQSWVYEHHGDYEETDVARRAAEVRLSQHRARAVTGRGRSQCRRLACGARFVLEEHDIHALNREYVITRVEHEGFSADTTPRGKPMYANRFECAPAEVPFRPRRPKRRVAQTVETAMVVGPEGHEIHTDPFGRIKVQFHWDREGGRNEHSSCWLRVSQAWAGAGWGVQFIPRIGMEVLVTFLGGDVDRPIVTGCVYNAVNPPPFVLPAHKTRSGIVTRSTTEGGGSNELSFEDSKGEEQIRIHAHRDFDEEVRRRHTMLIGEDQLVEVRGDQRNEVGGDQRALVSGRRFSEVSGDQAEHVHGSRSVRVERDDARTVGGNHATVVHGVSKEIVEGDVVKLYRDGFALQVDGQATTTIGAEGDAGRSDFYVFGDQVTGAEGSLTLTAKKSITLQCGDSIISLTPEGLKIGAKTLALAGAEGASMKGKGPALHLGDEAELVAKTIRIFSKSASLELDEHAHLRGDTVKLNCDTAEAPEEDPDTGRRKTKPLRVRLSDVAMVAHANKTYRLVVGGNVYEGTTGPKGEVEQEIPEAATAATLTVWIEEYPEGPRQQYSLRLKEIAPADVAAGAVLRLRNLGYYTGVAHETITALPGPAAAALKEFQQDHGLGPTGKLDGSTAAKLKEVYGH